jgi:hypothetical protein
VNGAGEVILTHAQVVGKIVSLDGDSTALTIPI